MQMQIMSDDDGGGSSSVPRISKLEKKQLIEDIHRLDRQQRVVIIQVIQKYDIPYDKNRSGIYVEINSVPDTVLYHVKKFVDSCIENKRMEEERYRLMVNAKKSLSKIPLGGVSSVDSGAGDVDGKIE